MVAATGGWEIVTSIATCVAALAAAAALVGVFFASRSLRASIEGLAETRTDRSVRLIGDLGVRWNEAPLEESRALMLIYGSEGIERALAEWRPQVTTFGLLQRFQLRRARRRYQDVETLMRVPNFFEDVALLVDCGKLDIALVSRAFKAPALVCWRYWEPAIRKMQGGDPSAYTEYTQLVDSLKRIEAQGRPDDGRDG